MNNRYVRIGILQKQYINICIVVHSMCPFDTFGIAVRIKIIKIIH